MLGTYFFPGVVRVQVGPPLHFHVLYRWYVCRRAPSGVRASCRAPVAGIQTRKSFSQSATTLTLVWSRYLDHEWQTVRCLRPGPLFAVFKSGQPAFFFAGQWDSSIQVP